MHESPSTTSPSSTTSHLVRCIAALVAPLVCSCGGGGGGDAASAPLAAVAAAASAPDISANSPVTTPPTWQKIAAEGESFALEIATSVRYGTGTSWVSQMVVGNVTCSNTFFGVDPKYNVVKECDVMTGGTPASPPTVDATKLAASNPGFSTARVMPANVADPSQRPNASDLGAFREPCDFSHMSFDDPIVFPGQPGKSHLHTFFGNTGTNASTTAASLASSGNSTCAGGILNRSAYWVPAVIDTRTGTPVKPSSSIFYYKTGYNGIAPSAIKPFPPGLRMVSGNPANTLPQGYAFNYGCIGPVNAYWADHTIPACAVGEDMIMSVNFPQCWDGVNLDSPDHISHMSLTVNGACPASHPVPVPEISFVVHYTVKATDAPAQWRLSSDNYDPTFPAGYSGHGDWFNGWDPATMNTFVKNCEQASMDCHAYLLGDGTMLY